LLRIVTVAQVADERVTDEYAAVEHGVEPPGRESGSAAVVPVAVATVVPDPRRRRPGRGAHIHPNLDCLAQAQRRRAISRALRLAGAVNTAAVHEYVTSTVTAQAGRQ
jgi:hypothetical protein